MIELNTTPYLVQNQYLAEIMAYAEAPYRETALAARSNGLDVTADELLSQATAAANRAGRDIVRVLHLDIESSAAMLPERRTLTGTRAGEPPYTDFPPYVPPEEMLPQPVIHNHRGHNVAEIVATIATARPQNRYAAAIGSELSMSQALVGQLLKALTAEGFLAEGDKVPSGTTGPPYQMFNPTEKFNHFVTRVPEWRRMVTFRVLRNMLEMDDAGAMDYLLQLGQTTLLMQSDGSDDS